MRRKNYEMNNDYILDVLEEAENKLLNEIIKYIPKAVEFKFSKYLAVRNKIEEINIENAFEEGLNTSVT